MLPNETARTSRVDSIATRRALAAFTCSTDATLEEAMRSAIEAALPFLRPAEHTLPDDEGYASRTIADIEMGGTEYTWRVVSDCGVVKVYSSRDGCLFARNATRARLIARELAEAIEDAADSVDRASRGGVR